MCKSYLEASKQNVKHSYILYENTLDWIRLSSPFGPNCWLNSHRKSLLALRRISKVFFSNIFSGNNHSKVGFDKRKTCIISCAFMFQTVCSHMMWYVNFQPKVILSLKIKSRAKTKTGNTHSVFSSAQKSVNDPCGAEEKLRYT